MVKNWVLLSLSLSALSLKLRIKEVLVNLIKLK